MLSKQDDTKLFPSTFSTINQVRTMFRFVSLPLLLCVATVSHAETKTCEDAEKTCSVITCGIPVTNGTPGRDGRDGPKGEKGEPGTEGLSDFLTLPPERRLPYGT